MLILRDTSMAIWVPILLFASLQVSRCFRAFAAAYEGVDRGASHRTGTGRLLLPAPTRETRAAQVALGASIRTFAVIAVGAGVLAYLVPFYLQLSVDALRIVRALTLGTAAMYLVAQLKGPPETRWVPRVEGWIGTIACVALIVLTFVLPA